ncbi:MAG: hypothetical protein PVG35_23535, partial [Desulfobacterales bacterium]
MVHSVSKNWLKVLRLSVILLCFLALLSCFVPHADALAPDSIRVVKPQNGFYVNRSAAAAFAVRGRADAGKDVNLFVNGVLLASASVDADGHFSVDLDFSSLIEGPVSLLVFQEGIRSIPITGIYDATPPRVIAANIDDRSISIVFNESHLQHVEQEANYRFSPSLNFKTAGGTDDITRIDDFSFQLLMRSIPPHEVIRLTLSEITDAAGNAIVSMPLALNDGDRDRMADSWEAQQGLNPLIADASSDADGDGFSNYQEYQARSNPLRVLSAPIEIRDTMPQDDAGIVNFARVADQTAVAVLVRAVYGIDLNSPSAVRFTIDDGYHLPYLRSLAHDAVRAVKLNRDPDAQATYLWVTYDRSLEPFMPTAYPLDAVVRVTVAIRDNRIHLLQPAAFAFKIESGAQKAAEQNVPETVEFYESELAFEDGYDAGIAVVDGKLAGAKLFYSSLEPITPEFGNPDALPANDTAGMQAAGVPVNLSPHTVFDHPVRLYIPVTGDVDIKKVGLAYYDGTRWLPAADADGGVLPGGEGWMMPGSRINHEDASPPMIEVQVYHFSAAQAAIIAPSGDPVNEDEDKPPSNNSGANV